VRACAGAGAGFLLAVLWFDLMFDVQALKFRGGELPEDVVASIAGYYRRVTTQARPMNRLVALVMVLALAALVAEVAGVGDVPRWAAIVSLVGAAVPIGLAGSRTVPRAVRLGSRRDPFAWQQAAVRAILREHLFCLACVVPLLLVQLLAR
jgi:hypothetical protein